MIEDKDRLFIAIHSFLAQLDSCKSFEKGVGGMTTDAQLARSYLIGVRALWVEDFRDTINQIKYGE